MPYSARLNKISLLTAGFGIILGQGFIIVALRLLERRKRIVNSEKFKEKYGTLCEGINVSKSRICKVRKLY